MRSESSADQAVGLILAGVIWGLWLCTLVFGLRLQSYGANGVLAFGLVLVRTFVHTGLFIIAHDSMHGSLVPSCQQKNRFIGRIALMLYAGLSYQACMHHHKMHHLKAESSDDPDFHLPGRGGLVVWFIRFMRSYLGMHQMIALALFWFAAAMLARILGGDPLWGVVVCCVIPLVLSSIQLFVVGTWLPHREGGVSHQASTPRSLPLQPWISLLACYHFGYHYEHHRFPDVPWFRLPRLRSRFNEGLSALVV